MTDFDRIVDDALEREHANELEWWWLSFADPGRPKGEQFLGVAIIEAHGLVHAMLQAHAAGINPGGEIQAVAIPAEHVPPEHLRDRLLDRAELEAAGL